MNNSLKSLEILEIFLESAKTIFVREEHWNVVALSISL